VRIVGGTDYKLTKTRNKNKDDQHQNTTIPFKKAAALDAETLPLQRKKT